MGDPRPVPAAGPRFGAVLKRFRIAAGLSQEALAERARISSDAVSTLERGVRRVPYRETVGLLADALQLSPADRERLESAADRRRGPRDVAASAAASFDADELRAPLTRLIGRERDLADICALLARPDVRLVTLTGPGGSGKTRLAIEAAAHAAAVPYDSAVLVPLAAVPEPRLVAGAIATRAGVRPRPGQTVVDALKAHFRDGRALLVLDNFEQLLAASSLVLDLVRDCPELHVLVTSREPLRVRGEVEYPVAPLDANGAAELFADRARAADPRFEPSAADGNAIAEIVRRLDRLPLALELAAPFVRTWSPAALLARLERPLDVLVGGPRDAPERQRTMRRTIEWSYNLLDANERRMLRRLAVFVGGFSTEAVEAVYDGPWFDVFTSLTGKSLLQSTRTSDGDGSVGMLETVREFALERLREEDELDDASRRHAHHLATFATEVRLGLRGESSAAWLLRCDRQLGNVRTALAWALAAGENELGLGLSSDLFIYWGRRGMITEGREWMEAFITLCERDGCADPLVLVRGLLVGGNLAMRLGDTALTDAWIHRGLRMATELGDDANIARARMALGIAAYEQRDLERARQHFEEAMPLWHAVGDAYDLVIARNNYAATLWGLGSLDQAAQMFAENIDVARSMSYAQLLPEVLANLGYLEQHRQNFAASESHLLESLELFRRAGDKYGAVYALTHLGETLTARGDRRRAEAFFREGLRVNRAVENREAGVHCLEGLATLAAENDDIDRALLLCMAAARERERALPPAEKPAREKSRDLLERLRERAGPEACARASPRRS